MKAFCVRCEKPVTAARLSAPCPICAGALISTQQAESTLGIICRDSDYILPDTEALLAAGRAGFEVPGYVRALETAAEEHAREEAAV